MLYQLVLELLNFHVFQGLGTFLEVQWYGNGNYCFVHKIVKNYYDVFKS